VRKAFVEKNPVIHRPLAVPFQRTQEGEGSCLRDSRLTLLSLLQQ
jgi:hypothetical protein